MCDPELFNSLKEVNKVEFVDHDYRHLLPASPERMTNIPTTYPAEKHEMEIVSQSEDVVNGEDGRCNVSGSEPSFFPRHFVVIDSEMKGYLN